MMAPPWFWGVTAFLFGITIGSFLNVVIYRLPRGESLSHPPSHCPYCENRLTAIDLIPLLSFLALGRKCRRCKKPIAWRYFGVELLTGLLFVALYLHFSHDPSNSHNLPNCIALLLLTAVLIPIFFIDLATFQIDASLNLFAFVIAVGRDVWGIAQREPGHELIGGWLPRSILGAGVGIAIFGAVRVAGWLWKRQEAMGLGDVQLARAMGAMLPSITPVGYNSLWLFPSWVLLSCFSGVIVGPALIWWRRAHSPQAQTQAQAGETEDDFTEEEDTSSLKQQLMDIGYVLWLGDAVEYIQWKMQRRQEPPEAQVAPPLEDDWTPAPTAIPFGPFLVVGFLATVFCGEAITAAYLAYAWPKPLPPDDLPR